MRVLIAILALTGAAFGQCPVSFGKPYAGHVVRIFYGNQSEKTIKAVKFDVTLYDRTRDPQDNRTLVSDFKLKPGQKKNAEWNNWWNSTRLMGGISVTVRKVLYEDGSEWNAPDDSCGFTKMF